MSDSRTVEAAPRTYDFLSEHHWHDSKTFPTADVLHEADDALGGVAEFMVDPICNGVAARVLEEDGALSNEEIGRLVVWADSMNFQAQLIADAAEKVSYLARQSYSGSESAVSASGYVIDAGQYSREWRGLVGGPGQHA